MDHFFPDMFSNDNTKTYCLYSFIYVTEKCVSVSLNINFICEPSQTLSEKIWRVISLIMGKKGSAISFFDVTQYRHSLRSPII